MRAEKAVKPKYIFVTGGVATVPQRFVGPFECRIDVDSCCTIEPAQAALPRRTQVRQAAIDGDGAHPAGERSAPFVLR